MAVSEVAQTYAVVELAHTYVLAEFAHLLDVSVGVNLAYSLLEQVHSTWTQAYRNMIAKLSSDLDSLVEPGTGGSAINQYLTDKQNIDLKKCEGTSNFVVRIIRIWGFVSAVVLMLILGVVGFDPELNVSLCVINAVLILFVAPIPISSFCLLWYWKLKVKNANKILNDRTSELNNEVASAEGKLGIKKV